MPTLLHLDSSPSNQSVSRELTREFTSAWEASHPGGLVLHRDLAKHAPTPIDADWIGAAFTPEAALTPQQRSILAESDELISELERADEYVIGVAMINFGVPAVLKLWIDQVARRGKTFTYGAGGPKGLLTGKKATIVVASGGVYDPGTPAANLNVADPYLKNFLGFLGITDVNIISAGGTAALSSGKVDRQTFLQPVIARVRAASSTSPQFLTA